MTTILVTKDNEMLSDSQATIENFVIDYDCEKIENINGSLVGAGGRLSSCVAFKRWVLSECVFQEIYLKYPEIPFTITEEKEDDDFIALVLSPDGVLTVFEGNKVSYEVDKPYAIGTGAEYALCALDGGCNGIKAMGVAIKRDVYSGGDIQILQLEEIEEESQTYNK